jgi:hypothetical protein
MDEAAQGEAGFGCGGGSTMINFEFLIMNFELSVCASRTLVQIKDAREASTSIHNSKFTIQN